MDVAEYTPQELTRLQLGWLIREDPGNVEGGAGGRSTQKRRIREGQDRARRDMMQDLGFD